MKKSIVALSSGLPRNILLQAVHLARTYEQLCTINIAPFQLEDQTFLKDAILLRLKDENEQVVLATLAVGQVSQIPIPLIDIVGSGHQEMI